MPPAGSRPFHPSSPVSGSGLSFRNRGFTLVEILGAVAIIAVLVALLFPAANKLRDSAKQATYISRLRQCGAAITAYAGEHQNCLPDPDDKGYRRWMFYVAPYVGPYSNTYDEEGRVSGMAGGAEINDLLYKLPVFRDPVQEAKHKGTGHGIFGYNVNLNHTYPEGARMNSAPVNIARIAKPSQFIVMATTEATSQGNGGGIQLEASGPSPMAAKKGYAGATRPRGAAPLFGRNAAFLFADGHVSLADVCDPDAWPWKGSPAFSLE